MSVAVRVLAHQAIDLASRDARLDVLANKVHQLPVEVPSGSRLFAFRFVQLQFAFSVEHAGSNRSKGRKNESRSVSPVRV